MIVSLDLDYDQSSVQGEIITAEHFGLNYVYDYERIGDLPWERFDEVVDAVGTKVIRYPGGSEAEKMFDITNPNSSVFVRPDGSIQQVMPLDKFLAFTIANDIQPVIIIPTAMALTEHYINGHRGFNENWEKAISDFVIQALSASLPNGILSFELGNEYRGFMTPTEYGRVASSMAKIVDQAIEKFWVENNISETLEQPNITVQIWTENAGENVTIDDLIAHNDAVLNEFSADEFAALNAVVGHFYYFEGRHQGKENEHNYWNIDEAISISTNLMIAWNEQSNDTINFVISEWNVSHNNAGNTGLSQIPVILEMFSSFLSSGVSQLDFWSAQYHGTSLSSANGTLMAAGTLFKMMQTELIGSRASDISFSNTNVDIHAFESEDRYVAYISSLTTEETIVDLGLDTILIGYRILSATLISVDETSADGIYKNISNLPIYFEPDVKFELTNLSIDGISFEGNFTFDLHAYETIVFVFEKLPEHPVEGLTIRGTIENEILEGSNDDDLLYGLLGDDHLVGNEGNDWLYGGDGSDIINGGSGDDFIFGGYSKNDTRDIIYAGSGDDVVEGGYGNDLVYGGQGNDTISGEFGADELIGQDGDDVISGGALSDVIFGGAGNDFINGGYGHDRLNGGLGADKFFHLGIPDHGSDWIQDYSAVEGDMLVWGDKSDDVFNFHVSYGSTGGAGETDVQEAFVTYIPNGQIVWALVDGASQTEILLVIGGHEYDLLIF